MVKRLPDVNPRNAQPAIANRFWAHRQYQSSGVRGQSGQGFGEYALLLFVIVLAVALGIPALSGSLSTFFAQAAATVSGMIP